jgi:hypothetical protein
VLLNKDRLFHWYVGALLSWIAGCLLLYIPFFHLLLGFPIAKIVVSAGIGCAGQMVVTPWLFSARATARNPTGKVFQTTVAVIVWISLSALLFFYYIQRGWPKDSDAQLFRACLFGVTIVFAVGALIVAFLRDRRSS